MSDNRHPRRWWILVVLCLSTLVLVIDNMVLTVAVPPLTADLEASAQDIQWVLDSYMLVFAGLLLTAGSLADRFGRRKVMVVGLALFGVASVVATVASSPGELIAARVVMGVGGALVMPSTLSILITVFDEDERRKAMAAWSAVAMVGLIGGPVLGGALIAWFWWGAVFLINVPVAVLAIVAALWLMPESRGPWQKPDPLGAVLSAVGMTALVWMIIELPQHGFAHPDTLVALAMAVLGLAGFVVWELRTSSPMVPLELFRNRDFSGGSLSLTLVQIGNGGLLLVLTQYLQFVLGYSPTQAGLAFIPMALASLVFNSLGAALGSRVDNRTPAVGGMVVMAAGFGLLATLTTGEGVATLVTALVLLGAGGGLAMPAAIAALMGAVPPAQAGVGSALNDTIQQMGAALGVAVLGSVVAGSYTAAMPSSVPERARQSIGDAMGTGDAVVADTARAAFSDAMSTAFVAGAVGVLAAAVLAAFVMRGRRPAPEPELAPVG
ncbi:EmrB/QacA subfamily drug resistance transporter [Saccharothrix tamanrassetensis]|uniref:EmrB/QacA subfamily drug resistance transporter n=1 Tax=Saccharothrix tamanrassetensis TaxID=1051531 RepID=A0A841CPM3_9PSEU|nr:MFS transporter [Saccharothrix tamanrassetensis]MBB5957945.1 EmrB/QacA subfamily drug resistance transporter [Saccharothrix tamanrassetensis]